MNLVGKRVRVKQGGASDYLKERAGLTGLVTSPSPTYDWAVKEDGKFVGVFQTDELVVLGGRHAGEPHPQNFENAPLSSYDALQQLWDAENHGKRAAESDMDAELDAWREHRDAL